MLETSAWLSSELNQDGSESYFFINTEIQCMVATTKSASLPRDILIGIPVWYREIDADEVETTVCNRSNHRIWKRSIYRIYDDFFQWVNLSDNGTFSFIYYRVDMSNISKLGVDAYNKSLKHIKRIENHPFA